MIHPFVICNTEMEVNLALNLFIVLKGNLDFYTLNEKYMKVINKYSNKTHLLLDSENMVKKAFSSMFMMYSENILHLSPFCYPANIENLEVSKTELYEFRKNNDDVLPEKTKTIHDGFSYGNTITHFYSGRLKIEIDPNVDDLFEQQFYNYVLKNKIIPHMNMFPIKWQNINGQTPEIPKSYASNFFTVIYGDGNPVHVSFPDDKYLYVFTNMQVKNIGNQNNVYFIKIPCVGAHDAIPYDMTKNEIISEKKYNKFEKDDIFNYILSVVRFISVNLFRRPKSDKQDNQSQKEPSGYLE